MTRDTIEREIRLKQLPGESYFRVTVNVTHWTILGELFELAQPIPNQFFTYASDEAAARQTVTNYQITHGERGVIMLVEKLDVPF